MNESSVLSDVVKQETCFRFKFKMQNYYLNKHRGGLLMRGSSTNAYLSCTLGDLYWFSVLSKYTKLLLSSLYTLLFLHRP